MSQNSTGPQVLYTYWVTFSKHTLVLARGLGYFRHTVDMSLGNVKKSTRHVRRDGVMTRLGGEELRLVTIVRSTP